MASNPAPGETSLSTLLSTLTTVLHDPTYVFLTLLPATPVPPSLHIRMLFYESEGTTIITTKESAVEHNLEYSFPCRMITLNVHSSLEAVGFMAAVTTALTERGIGTNPVSGFFHDHLFVPLGKEKEALEVLTRLAKEAIETNAKVSG